MIRKLLNARRAYKETSKEVKKGMILKGHDGGEGNVWLRFRALSAPALAAGIGAILQFAGFKLPDEQISAISDLLLFLGFSWFVFDGVRSTSAIGLPGKHKAD